MGVRAGLRRVEGEPTTVLTWQMPCVVGRGRSSIVRPRPGKYAIPLRTHEEGLLSFLLCLWSG